jgi:hypothetical protein
VSGLAFDPADNTLYGCVAGPSFTGGLVRIDTATGEGTLLCSTRPLTDLAFDPRTGRLYGIHNQPGALYTIDLSTGAALLVGSTGLGNNLGLAFVPSEIPRLSVALLPSAQILITWSTNFKDYLLEFTTSVPGMNWNFATNRVSVSEGQFAVTVVTGAPQHIFRLRRPD